MFVTPCPSDAAKRFITSLPPAYSGTLSNFFHHAARAGAKTPSAVVDVACASVRVRVKYYAQSGKTQKADAFRAFLLAVHADPIGATEYATFALLLATLPDTVRVARREERAALFVADFPATPKQTDFLRRLGYDGPAPETRAGASCLIVEHKAAKMAEQTEVAAWPLPVVRRKCRPTKLPNGSPAQPKYFCVERNAAATRKVLWRLPLLSPM